MGIDDETEEIVKEFLVESSENLDQLDRDLVMLEEDPSNGQVLASVFRTIHTIKGTCGFLGYTKLESVSHVAESLLSRLRDGTLSLTPEITSALLATTDAVREILAQIETTRSEGDGDYSALVATLTALQSGEPAAAATTTIPESLAAVQPPAESAEAPEAAIVLDEPWVDEASVQTDEAPIPAPTRRSASTSASSTSS